MCVCLIIFDQLAKTKTYHVLKSCKKISMNSGMTEAFVGLSASFFIGPSNMGVVGKLQLHRSCLCRNLTVAAN